MVLFNAILTGLGTAIACGAVILALLIASYSRYVPPNTHLTFNWLATIRQPYFSVLVALIGVGAAYWRYRTLTTK
jgi:hypothetical protein